MLLHVIALQLLAIVACTILDSSASAGIQEQIGQSAYQACVDRVEIWAIDHNDECLENWRSPLDASSVVQSYDVDYVRVAGTVDRTRVVFKCEVLANYQKCDREQIQAGLDGSHQMQCRPGLIAVLEPRNNPSRLDDATCVRASKEELEAIQSLSKRMRHSSVEDLETLLLERQTEYDQAALGVLSEQIGSIIASIGESSSRP